MAREIRYYEGDERRFTPNNLYCPICGNTNAFSIDLRLKHSVVNRDGQLTVGLDRSAQKVLQAISKNLWKIVDKGHNEYRSLIKCANCKNNEWLDLHERIIDWCWQMGCPGCFHCQSYIEKEYLLELCNECISERDGRIADDDCQIVCPHYDEGLEHVRYHYGITLEDMKLELGY